VEHFFLYHSNIMIARVNLTIDSCHGCSANDDDSESHHVDLMVSCDRCQLNKLTSHGEMGRMVVPTTRFDRSREEIRRHGDLIFSGSHLFRPKPLLSIGPIYELNK
jgi:hypothetical protein